MVNHSRSAQVAPIRILDSSIQNSRKRSVASVQLMQRFVSSSSSAVTRSGSLHLFPKVWSSRRSLTYMAWGRQPQPHTSSPPYEFYVFRSGVQRLVSETGNPSRAEAFLPQSSLLSDGFQRKCAMQNDCKSWSRYSLAISTFLHGELERAHS